MLDDLTVFGGKGAFMARNAVAYGRGMYEFNRCNFQGFTEAAIANLSVDFGRIIVKGCFFWASGTVADGDLDGMGLALRGIADNSLIEGNFFHKARYGAKLGSGASVAWLRHNSFLRPAEATGGMTDIWIVPAEVPGDVPGGGIGRGLQITGNRHGNEGIGDDDFRILVADADTESGNNFANQGHSTTASSGRVDGVIAERNYVGGGGSVTRPYIYSYVPKMKGWVLANQLENVPGEIGYAPGLTYNMSAFFQGTNRLSTKYSGIDLLNKAQVILGDAAFMWQIDDPMSYYAGALSAPQAVPGSGYDTNFLELKAPLVSSAGSSGAPVATPETDTYGGQHRLSIAFAGDDAELTGSHRYLWGVNAFTSDDVGKIAWFEFDMMQAAATPLDTIAFTVRSASGTRMSRLLTVPAKMKTIRIPFVVSAAESCSMNIHPVGWVTGSKTSVIIERPRAYLASEPVNQGYAKSPSSDWDKAHLVVGSHHYFHDNLSHPRVKIGSAPASQTDGFHMALRVTPPATATSAGTQGQWSDDGAYFYICTGINIWKRVSIAGW